MTTHSLDGLVTVREAGARLGLSKQRMHQLIAYYKIQTTEVPGICKLVPLKDLERFAKLKRPNGVRRNPRNG